MKSLNNELWNDINVEELEVRDEFGIFDCIDICVSCFCWDCFCFKCFSISL